MYETLFYKPYVLVIPLIPLLFILACLPSSVSRFALVRGAYTIIWPAQVQIKLISSN